VKLKVPETGNRPEVIWTNSDIDPHHGGLVLINDHLYGSNWKNNRDGNWICVNWQTGKTIWEDTWYTKGSIISADNKLFCYEDRTGHMGMFKISTDSLINTGEFKIPYGDGPHWAHPVIDKGRMYVRHGNSLMVYCLRKSCEQ
jgi:outer membrane protein assembly factor BamB